MSVITKFVAPAELLLQPGRQKETVAAIAKSKFAEPSSRWEAEQSFWKLSARANAPKFALIEMVVFVLFLLLAVVAIASCFAELSHLLESDAVGHVAAKAISGGA